MNNTFGNNVSVTLFGESHGPAIGAVLDGIAPGIPVSTENIIRALSRRRPQDNETKRVENDDFEILSGVFNGRTTGTPLTIIIKNSDVKNSDYTYGIARPSHADYSAYTKYHGFEDYRGGGHFSGRITAPLTAVGGILIPALNTLGIHIGSHVLQCGSVKERGFLNINDDISVLEKNNSSFLEAETAEKVSALLAEAASEGDSVGGIVETAVAGLPAGVGEPYFDSIESEIAHAVFSIGGIKGIEFGAGFGFADMRGSEANDALTVENGRIKSASNNNGGILGGISVGMPVIFRCAVKPTPSIALAQSTVDFLKNENTNITVTGRHDPAIVRRVCPVIDAVTAIALCDLLSRRFGTDYLCGGTK